MTGKLLEVLDVLDHWEFSRTEEATTIRSLYEAVFNTWAEGQTMDSEQEEEVNKPHSLNHSVIHSFTHSLAHLHSPSVIHSLTHSDTPSPTHSLTRSLTHSLTHSRTHTATDSLAPLMSKGRIT